MPITSDGVIMQTRTSEKSAVKERPVLMSAPMVRAILNGSKTQTRRVVKWALPGEKGYIWEPSEIEMLAEKVKQCPYGVPGERLWVREAFHPYGDKCVYRASIPYGNLDCHFKPWKPSIFMPRWASRITLEITGVRVERLQDISEADAVAEGVKPDILPESGTVLYPAVENYAELWDSINGEGAWDKNPWVWVLEFKRVTDAD